MGVQLVSHIPLDLSGRAENEPAPDDTSQEHHDGNDGQLDDRIPDHAGSKAAGGNLVDGFTHHQRHFGLEHVDNDQDDDTDQVAPFVLPDKFLGIFASENVQSFAPFGLFLFQNHASFSVKTP